MITALIFATMLGQTAVAPAPSEIAAHSVLAPIEIVPVRTLRKNILGLELGWNSLAGVGVQYTRNLHPLFSIDGGLGLSGRGAQIGVRGRYNMLKRNVTPFLGLGFMYGSGTPNEVELRSHNNAVFYKVDRSPMAQGTVGVAWQTRHGMSLMGSAGWTQLLRNNNNNVLIKSGTPTKQQNDVLKAVSASGPTLALNVGYSF